MQIDSAKMDKKERYGSIMYCVLDGQVANEGKRLFKKMSDFIARECYMLMLQK